MSAFDAKQAHQLKTFGKLLGREGMSLRVLQAVEQFDGSYKGAMILVGRLKAVAQMARADGYWSEKVSSGYQQELAETRAAIAKAQPSPSDTGEMG